MEKNIVAVVLVVALLAIGAYLVVNTDTGGNVVSVSGVSEITTKPDFVSLYLNVETLDNSAQISEEENSQITEEIMSSLTKLGFAKDEIETISFNVYPEYEYNQNGRIFKGYKTIHMMKVSVEETDFVGVVIDKVSDAGALVNSVQFEITKEHENELKAEALELATKDAKNKAEAIARGSGGKLGKLVSVNTNDYGYYPYVAYMAGDSAGSVAEAKSSVTQISTRELTVSANVQASYKIR